MRCPGLTATLQHVHEPHQVGVDVGVRVLDAVAHARLGGQMDHHVEPAVANQAQHPISCYQIDPLEGEAGIGSEQGQPRLFEPRIVIGIQVVQPDDAMPLFQQASGEVKTDKPGSPRDQNMHSYPRIPCACVCEKCASACGRA